jgi:hypothetical protein
MKQYLDAAMTSSITNTSIYNDIVSSLTRQGTNQGYSTRFDFEVSVSWTLLVENLLFSDEYDNSTDDYYSNPDPVFESLINAIGVAIDQGFDATMDAAVLFNFTIIINDNNDIRLEVKQLCFETIPGYKHIYLHT